MWECILCVCVCVNLKCTCVSAPVTLCALCMASDAVAVRFPTASAHISMWHNILIGWWWLMAPELSGVGLESELLLLFIVEIRHTVQPITLLLASLQMLKLHVCQTWAQSYRKTINLVLYFPPGWKEKWKFLGGMVWMLCLPYTIRWKKKRSARVVLFFFSTLNLPSITKPQRNTASEHLFQVWHHLEWEKLNTGGFYSKWTHLCSFKRTGFCLFSESSFGMYRLIKNMQAKCVAQSCLVKIKCILLIRALNSRCFLKGNSQLGLLSKYVLAHQIKCNKRWSIMSYYVMLFMC